MKEREPQTEIYRVAEELANTFIQRWDLYAQQDDDGRYRCMHEPLTMDHVVNHLKGEITLGTYLLDEDNQARFVVLDADEEKAFDALREVAFQIPSYLETSRRGGHLWAFFEEAIQGTQAKSFGEGLLAESGVEMEVFPKQGQSQGPGSLVRLPFGIHRKSGERYPFINPDGSLLGRWTDQMEALMNPKKVGIDLIEKFTPKKDCIPLGEPSESENVWDQVKAHKSAYDFIQEFVELKKSGDFALGHCPFHDDQHPSFSVNVDENYWHCFAGCGGGSIIDFWMKWMNCDFNTATKQLAERFGVLDE